MNRNEAIVIGAGPSGVATALALKDRGLRPLVIDRAEQVCSSWRGRYDRLRLNTWRPFSHLPDRPYPRGTPTFPSRDQLIKHVEEHAGEGGFDLRLGTPVETIERDGADWAVRAADGQMTSREVVVATGHQNVPVIPEWPGRDRFRGRLLHASEYRNAEPFREQSVLVVGPGCSGMEIASELAEQGARKVWLAVRTPPNILLRQGAGKIPGDLLGVMMMRLPSRIGDAFARFGRRMDIGDLSEFGLPVPEEGVMSRLRRTGDAPAVVDREVIEAIRAGRIEVVGAVESLEERAVRLNGGAVEPDAVVAATGYRRGLEDLVGHLGVLDRDGLPRARGETPAAPGLRFIGYTPRPGGLGYMAKEAKRAARAIARELGA
jgi:cation diffusion facilitator CzcD-associated flavoprotein CzcO